MSDHWEVDHEKACEMMRAEIATLQRELEETKRSHDAMQKLVENQGRALAEQDDQLSLAHADIERLWEEISHRVEWMKSNGLNEQAAALAGILAWINENHHPGSALVERVKWWKEGEALLKEYGAFAYGVPLGWDEKHKDWLSREPKGGR